jgi:predicted phage tail protein
MVAGGVVQMLSPQPKMGKGSADSADNQASYIFNGPVNVTAQGAAVPILYGGPMEIGSTVISAGIEAVDYSSRQSNVGAGTANGNSKKTPYDPD